MARFSQVQKIELLIFGTALLAFAWFHQGGGWNQNARFAEVRAIVEQGRFAIDDYLVYRVENGGAFQRLPVERGQVELEGERRHLAWTDSSGLLHPIAGGAPLDPGEAVPIFSVGASGDVSYARDHFHPNKPPGVSLIAVPAYFALFHIERMLGIQPDHWWTLAVNAWLTSLGSVGVISAFGCVLFFRVATRLIGGELRPALFATLAFAFGTLFFPFGTVLFDHNLTATALLAAWYFLTRQEPALATAGLCAGFAAITNYLAAIPVAMLALHLIARRRSLRAAALYAAGVIVPLLVICGYNAACFGSPFALANDFQNPLFADPRPALFGMFGMPSADIALMLLASPMRGIFYSSPVLLAGFYGLWKMSHRSEWRADALLFAAICGFFYLANASFYGWHAGFSAGSRYLIPALPFLALPAVFAFRKFPRATGLLAILSVAMQLALTATDAQSPVGIGSHARVEPRSLWNYNPISQYALPLLFTGRAWPLLHAQIELLHKEERPAAAAAIEHGEPAPLLLGAITGPVSVNPIGMAEGSYFARFPAGSESARWSSFNAGEFLFPGSLWSLAPLLALAAAAIAAMLRAASPEPA